MMNEEKVSPRPGVANLIGYALDNDIQLGFVLGAWLGPMRMALTLFFASFLSLIVWMIVSIIHGFDKDRAIPLGPFLSVAGIGVYVGSFYYPKLFYLLTI